MHHITMFSIYRSEVEWIAVKSNRLRNLNTRTFEVDEKCTVRWSNSQKYQAIVLEILDNGMHCSDYIFIVDTFSKKKTNYNN